MASIVVGPLLRGVDETSALIWLETDRPCTVTVLGSSVRTFAVHGHHYGLVDVRGLVPGSDTPYTVALDGEVAWPERGSAFPPSRIRTMRDGGPLRLTFGSCRMSMPHDARHNRKYGADMLHGLARRLASSDDGWPDVLLLLGDQVYADETSPAMRRFIETRRDATESPGWEVADFEEYAHLYRLAWSDPAVRWLLSTVPAMMIFDDHDIRDDWNISAAWREQMAATPWWRRRIIGGLASYWLYQHVGNMAAAERAEDPLLEALQAADGDAGTIMDEFAWKADQDPASVRWSYARDVGPVRLIMLDTRCGRVLDRGHRAILDQDEWSWAMKQLDTLDGIEHVLIGTSLPFLLPQGVHDLEAWNEAVADGVWGNRAARIAEAIRQGIDLEHWAAFGASFRGMAEAVMSAATRPGSRPATVCFLSGDVHYSYGATMSYPGWTEHTSRVHQLVSSPMRNPLNRVLCYANRLAASKIGRLVGTCLAKAARVPKSAVGWTVDFRPRFDNGLATVELAGRAASVRWESPAKGSDGPATLAETMHMPL